MTRKRLLAMLSAGVLAVSGMTAFPAEAQITLNPQTERTSEVAAKGATIMADKVYAEPGEKVEYGVYIANNPGFSSLDGWLDYDEQLAPYVYESTTVKTAVPWEKSMGIDPSAEFIAARSKTPTSYCSDDGTGLRVTMSANGEINRMAFGSLGSNDNTVIEGYFCFCYFKVPDDAKPGTIYPIQLNVSRFINTRLDSLKYITADGWIQVAYESGTTEETTTTWWDTSDLGWDTTWPICTTEPMFTTVSTYTTCTTSTVYSEDIWTTGTPTKPAYTGTMSYGDEPLMTKIGNNSSSESYYIDLDGLDPSKIYRVELGLSVDSGYVKGGIGGYDLSDKWKTYEFTLEDENYEGYVSGIRSTIVDGFSANEPMMLIQFWWINPFYNEEGTEDKAGTAYLHSVTLYDQNGGILRSFPADYSDVTTATEDTRDSGTKTRATGTIATPGSYIYTTAQPRRMQAGLRKYDMNRDGNVGIADAVLLNRYIASDGWAILNEDPDVDGDGIITIGDSSAMLKALKPFSLTVGKAAAKPGETVTIPVKVFGDKGTAGGQVYIDYDPRLTPVSVKVGDAYNMNLQTGTDGYPLYLSWLTINGMDQIAKDGAVLVNLEFKVDENIDVREFLPVSIYNGYPVYTYFSDYTGYQYDAAYGSGYITVLP